MPPPLAMQPTTRLLLARLAILLWPAVAALHRAHHSACHPGRHIHTLTAAYQHAHDPRPRVREVGRNRPFL